MSPLPCPLVLLILWCWLQLMDSKLQYNLASKAGFCHATFLVSRSIHVPHIHPCLLKSVDGDGNYVRGTFHLGGNASSHNKKLVLPLLLGAMLELVLQRCTSQSHSTNKSKETRRNHWILSGHWCTKFSALTMNLGTTK
jgi:hypothetical protein